MRVTNKTKLSTDYLRALAVAVKPERCTRVKIEFKYTSHRYVCGRAGGRSIVIKVPRAWGSFPHKHIDRDGYLGVVCYSQEEDLVYVIAHEFRHVWQCLVPSGWRVHGARNSGYSERDADAYGLHVLRQYRRGEIRPSAS